MLVVKLKVETLGFRASLFLFIIVSFIAAGYGSKRAKSTRIHGDLDLQHCNERVGTVSQFIQFDEYRVVEPEPEPEP
jgi:hypothetical protein